MNRVSPRMTLLTASGVCSLIVLDTNIVAVTLPTIARDLGANFADIEWVVSAYMLTFAALLLPAGSIADRFGRQKPCSGAWASLFSLQSVAVLRRARCCSTLPGRSRVSARRCC